MSYLRSTLVAACALLGGCAGTQSQQAFVPRRAPAVVRFVPAPNVSADHDRSLEAVLDRSLRQQELEDERADLLALPPAPDLQSAAKSDDRPASDERSAKEAPSPKEGPAPSAGQAAPAKEAPAPAVGVDRFGVTGLQP